MIRLPRLIIISAMSLLFSLSAPTVLAQQTEDFTVGLDLLALERFEDAHTVFQQLMPLGSSDAAYMIGLMLIEERGVEYNPVASLGYLFAARAWGNEQAQEIIEQIEPHLSAAEKAEANQLLVELNRSVQVSFQAEDLNLDMPPPEAINRPTPRMTSEVALSGNHGWLEVIIGINPEGRIVAMQPLNAADRNFLREAGRAFQRWRYTESENVSITTVSINYTQMSSDAEADVLSAYNDALNQANAGVTEQQVYLGGLTEALVRYESEQVDALPEAFYWYERAARNGNIQAQRLLALRYVHPAWAEYLITQGDIDVMAWHGMRLLMHAESAEQRERGRELLENAAEAGSSIAEELIESY